MLFRSPAARRAVGIVAALAAGCSRRPGGPAGPDAVEPGSAALALAGAYCISQVQTDPRTFHFDSPRWVLDASEGFGPRVLGVTIAGLASPLVSVNVTQPPGAGDLSAAVGYSLSEFYFIQASALHTVAAGTYERLEAYLNYARSTWVIQEAGCGAVLGAGESFKPIGVYFRVRPGASVALDGTSVVSVLPGCAGGQCGYSPDPPGDAGAGDKGAGDKAAGDAGGE